MKGRRLRPFCVESGLPYLLVLKTEGVSCRAITVCEPSRVAIQEFDEFH